MSKARFKSAIKKIPRQLKGLLPQMGIAISLLMLMHSIWQMDLICVRPVWQTGEWIPWFLNSGYEVYSEMPFQCGFFFRTNIGIAYDYYLAMIVTSWFLLLVSMWFYHWRKTKIYKETIRDLEYLLREE